MKMGRQSLLRAVAGLLLALVFLTMFLSFAEPAQARSFDKVVYANADPNKYYIEVDLTNKVITIYEKGEKSKKFDQIAQQFICTIGTDATPTPEGSFKLNEMRRRFGYFREFDVYAQYWTNVSGGIYFHSILYPTPVEGNFTRSSYRALGGKASHGCIRMLVEDARWLYYNCPAGTKGLLTYKEKDETLRKSLIPSMSYDDYRKQVKANGDEYEAAKRSLPTALVKSTAIFTGTDGKTYTAQPGTAVSVVSSGGSNCRVRWNGAEGHIDTKYLEFLPNGPKDQKASQKAIEEAQGHYQVSSDSATLYERANLASPVLGKYGEGTDLKMAAGATASFYKVELDGQTGYIRKEEVTLKKGKRDGSAKVYRLDDPSAEIADDEGEEEIIDLANFEGDGLG